MEAQYIRRYHKHEPKENQCTSEFVKHIKAPVDLVWSLVRRFDQPQRYKPFVSRCVMQGDLNIGSLRQVNVKSGLPATTSTERLELLNDEEHILGIRIIGGDHRLKYLKGCQETTTLKWKQGWGLKSSEFATPYNCKTKVASIDSIFLTINHGCYFYGIIWYKVGKLVEVVVIREKGDAPLNLTMVVVDTSPDKFNREV